MRISLLQDSPGLLAINGFALPAKLAEKRKIIEEIAHNDVKKVSKTNLTLVLLITRLFAAIVTDGNQRRQVLLKTRRMAKERWNSTCPSADLKQILTYKINHNNFPSIFWVDTTFCSFYVDVLAGCLPHFILS